MGQQQEPDGEGNRQRNGKAPRRLREDADRPRGCRRFGHVSQDTCRRVTLRSRLRRGLTLRSSAPSSAIASAVQRLLEEPQFRERAQRMAAFVTRDTQQDLAVKDMETLATASGR